MKHVIAQPRHIRSEGAISLELDMPEISIEIPTPTEIAKSTATIIAAALQRTIQAGQDATGAALRAPKQSTLERRLRDKYPPAHPRSNRWIERYPGRVRAMLSGTLTPGVVKSRTTRFGNARTPYKRTTRFKNLSVSQLAAVDSGMLWSKIRLAAAGGGAAEVEAPEGRPIADIEARLGAQIFCATEAHLDAAMRPIMDGVFASWGAAGGSGPALSRALK